MATHYRYAVGLQLEFAYGDPDPCLIVGLSVGERECIAMLPYTRRSFNKAPATDLGSIKLCSDEVLMLNHEDGAFEVRWIWFDLVDLVDLVE